MVGKATITTTASLKFANFHVENETSTLLNMKWSVNQWTIIFSEITTWEESTLQQKFYHRQNEVITGHTHDNLQDLRSSQICCWRFWTFWNVMLWCWVSGFLCSEESQCLHLQGDAVEISLKMEALWSFKMSKTTHPITQHHFTKNLNFQQGNLQITVFQDMMPRNLAEVHQDFREMPCSLAEAYQNSEECTSVKDSNLHTPCHDIKICRKLTESYSCIEVVLSHSWQVWIVAKLALTSVSFLVAAQFRSPPRPH